MLACLRHVTVVSLVMFVAACSSGPTGTDRSPRATHQLDLCRPASGDAWVAYQNDGGTWATPTGENFSIEATDRLTVAVATPLSRASGATGSLSIYRLTAEQAQAMFGCAAPGVPFPGANKWSGVVSGLRGDTSGMLSAGKMTGWIANASHPAFTLGGVPDTAVDLLGVRIHYLASHWEPDVMIARPAQRLPNGATVPELNFDSLEAFPLQRSALTVRGVPMVYGFERYIPLVLQDELESPTGEITLAGGTLTPFDPNVGPATYSSGIFTVPAAKQWAPLTYSARIWVFTNADRPPASEIRATLYYRTPGDRTIAFPPAVSTPAISDEASSPYRRVRFDVASQPDYDAVMDVSFHDSRNDYFELYATREYFGSTPATWSLSIPDLSSAPGFVSSWAPQPGPLSWTVSARNQVDSTRDGAVASRGTIRGRT